MKFGFCFQGVAPGSAVSLAWLRLMNQFSHAGGTTEELLQGRSIGRFSMDDLRQVRSQEFIVCLNVWQVLLLRMLLIGSKARILYWVQGLVAEESYLKRKSWYRYILLRLIEFVAFLSSDGYIYVSSYMADFYDERYPLFGHRPRVVVACTSDLKSRHDVHRTPASFCYLGGMAPWQNFDVIVRLMNVIVRTTQNVTFNVATHEQGIARRTLEQHGSSELIGITNIVSLTGKSEVERFLSANQFGFLIRDDDSINRVSSPIKLAEYLSCGVSVITTNAIRSYVKLLGEAAHIVDVPRQLSSGEDLKFDYAGAEASLEIYERHFSIESVNRSIKSFIASLVKYYA
ncbi:glycosyltransferase [Cupriavidus sp. USMAHM13]|uniref:glycosyltransferase n=1 Tax=Cupriavidus sp. USMAHM13 TaxID=1389192 RepID=UPI0012EA0A24|nr:glycosyltransferase [Cupriavidus sp. USMAHM13]